MIPAQNLSSTNTSGGGGFAPGGLQLLGPIIAVALALGAALVLQSILSDDNANPVAMLLLVCGVLCAIFAQIRPAQAVYLFLWLAVTVDEGKRAAYALSDMSVLDVGRILIVPVLLMAAIYFRTIFLSWFRSAQTGIRPIKYLKFLPVIAITGLTAAAMIRAGGVSFGSISQNYAYICYIPAAMVIPHVLSQPKHWQECSRNFLRIFWIIGGYGLFQALNGPLPFEKTYLESGLTSTLYLMQDGRFRAFSTMNASSTFAGSMVIATLFALFYLGSKDGRFTLLNGKAVLLCGLCLLICAAATQRGALGCGLLTLCLIPLFRRPRALQIAFVVLLVLFILMVVNIDEVWLFVRNLDQAIEPLRASGFLSQNSSLLTFGARADSFQVLHEAKNWSAFGEGIGGDAAVSHDLTSALVFSVGWVGLSLFLGLIIGMLGIAGKTLKSLSHFPPAYAWAQVNLAVFLFVIIWSLLFGSVLYDNPLNFFFWMSVGNLLYLHRNPEYQSSALVAASPEEFGLKLKTRRKALLSFGELQEETA